MSLQTQSSPHLYLIISMQFSYQTQIQLAQNFYILKHFPKLSTPLAPAQVRYSTTNRGQRIILVHNQVQLLSKVFILYRNRVNGVGVIRKWMILYFIYWCRGGIYIILFMISIIFNFFIILVAAIHRLYLSGNILLLFLLFTFLLRVFKYINTLSFFSNFI